MEGFGRRPGIGFVRRNFGVHDHMSPSQRPARVAVPLLFSCLAQGVTRAVFAPFSASAHRCHGPLGPCSTLFSARWQERRNRGCPLEHIMGPLPWMRPRPGHPVFSPPACAKVTWTAIVFMEAAIASPAPTVGILFRLGSCRSGASAPTRRASWPALTPDEVQLLGSVTAAILPESMLSPREVGRGRPRPLR